MEYVRLIYIPLIWRSKDHIRSHLMQNKLLWADPEVWDSDPNTLAAVPWFPILPLMQFMCILILLLGCNSQLQIYFSWLFILISKLKSTNWCHFRHYTSRNLCNLRAKLKLKPLRSSDLHRIYVNSSQHINQTCAWTTFVLHITRYGILIIYHIPRIVRLFNMT